MALVCWQIARMSAITVQDALLSEQDYLAGEILSEEKHEYLAGVAYAMAGAGYEHNTICMNLIVALGTRLRGKPCQPFSSDMKVRVETAAGIYFYYPDAMVVCDPAGMVGGRHWTDRPVVIFEVLSKSTRRVDEGEKQTIYWSIPTLQSYVMIEQDKVQATVRRRGGGGEVLSGRETLLALPELELEIPLGELFERLAF